MAKRLSLKEKGFAKDFLETKGNGTEAAFRNYNVKNRNSAAVIASQRLSDTRITNEIDRLMETADIKDETLMDKLKEGLDANHVASYRGEAQQTELPDQNIRHKFFQDAAKMKGWLKEQVDVRSLNIDLQLESMSNEQRKDLLRGLLLSLDDKSIQATNNQRGEVSAVVRDGEEDKGADYSMGAEHQAFEEAEDKS